MHSNLINNKDLFNKCYECVNEKQNIGTFGLILLDKDSLKSKSIKYSNIKLKNLISIIYEDAFNTLGKISIVNTILPWVSYLILFIDAIKLNKKIYQMKITEINHENGVLLFILYHLLTQSNDDKISIQLLKKIYDEYYPNINNFDRTIKDLHENKYIKLSNGNISLEEEIDLV